MRKKIVFIIIVFLLPISNAIAQLSGGYDYSTEFDSILQQKFNFQVKQISQFFDRFNFKEEMTFNSENPPSRKRNVISLINFKDTGLKRNVQTLEFLKFVSNTSNQVSINYNDSNWYAIVHCSFNYKNKKVVIDVILRTEGMPKKGYSWVIYGVKDSSFFVGNEKKESKAKSYFINPMNHEIGFTELSKAISEKTNIHFYTSSSFHADALTTFLYMVQNGDLVLNKINSIDYQFLQVPGWSFVVSDFKRDDFNSGWLISSIKKMDDTQKNNYIRNVLKN